MDGNLSFGNIIPGASYGVLDLQGSLHPPNQQHAHNLIQRQSHQGTVHIPISDVFPFSVGNIHECDKLLSIVDHNKSDRGKTSTSDEDERIFTDDGVDSHNEVGNGKKASLWQRTKWSDGTVRLLITIVSYLGEDSSSECGSGGRKKSVILKGKWKFVSKVMAERRSYVSPQQCEDKFKDLNKRYKRLRDVLGKGTSCKVVENPTLLDMMDHLSEKAKDEVRKILSSKHLFYEEMCSYHHGNRLHLPADPALKRSLQLALRCEDEHDVDGDEQEEETEYRDDDLEENNNTLRGDNGGMIGVVCFPKRMKQRQDPEDANFGNLLVAQDSNKRSNPQSIQTDMRSHSLHLEEQKVELEVKMLELEKQKFKWQRFSRKKGRELVKLRMENERMKHENEQMALELHRRELDAADYR
ncbi:uncharacterized protein LOC143887342 [Tasmannia lanceolata]|uniref:uncharacterized protein LOC143887342 n=1 Tax=Tasmannia lanceolata TaxID=3420 RepID=UPI004063ADB7